MSSGHQARGVTHDFGKQARGRQQRSLAIWKPQRNAGPFPKITRRTPRLGRYLFSSHQICVQATTISSWEQCNLRAARASPVSLAEPPLEDQACGAKGRRVLSQFRHANRGILRGPAECVAAGGLDDRVEDEIRAFVDQLS
jgi:hypothetical protein